MSTRVLTTPDYVEGTCLKASMDFISEEFGLVNRFEGKATLIAAVRFFHANNLLCVVRAKPLMKIRLRIALWASALDVPVIGQTGSPAYAAIRMAQNEPKVRLYLIYSHYLYHLPLSERWWHYVVEVVRGGGVYLFDSFFARAKETFGEESVANYPSPAELDILSEISINVGRPSNPAVECS